MLYIGTRKTANGTGQPREAVELTRGASHAAPQTQHEVQSRFLLDVVVRERTTVLELLACEDQALLVWWNALLVLNFGLHVVDRVRGLHIESDRLACEGLDEDLHAAPQTQHQMQSRFLLDVVVRESTTIFELLACEDQALLVWWNALLVLNFGLHVVDPM